jgi:Condensation domain
VTGAEPLSPAKRALLERALLRRRESSASLVTIQRRLTAGPAPLSFAQQSMWFLDQWEPGAPTFNGARALRLRGVLDRDALERSLRTVIERHESLRTVIVPGGAEPLQRAMEEWSFELELVPGTEAELDGQLRDLSRRPFDLTCDLMLRATLVELGGEDHMLLLGMHHIAADAHSDTVLFTELAECYAADRGGRPAELAALPIQYADYAVWQREHLRGQKLEELRSYWARTLEGAPELLRLPTDRPRLPVQRTEGSHHHIELDRTLADGLVALGRDEGATLFITMLAAFTTLLYRLSGEEDIVIGSPIANRNNLELQGLIGFFTNTLALRTRLGGNPSFREVIGRARETALGAYAHQALPFERVVEAVAPKRDPSYNPLFQVNFRAQATERPVLGLDGLDVEPIAVDIGFSRFDLALELELGPHALGGYFEYDRDLFDTASIESFEANLRTLLEQVVAQPDAPILALAHSSRKAAGRSIRRRQKS